MDTNYKQPEHSHGDKHMSKNQLKTPLIMQVSPSTKLMIIK